MMSFHWITMTIHSYHLELQDARNIQSLHQDLWVKARRNLDLIIWEFLETPLMKCVQSTDSWNHKEFPEIVKALGNSVMLQDKKGFTVLHHVVYAASKGKRIFSACNKPSH